MADSQADLRDTLEKLRETLAALPENLGEHRGLTERSYQGPPWGVPLPLVSIFALDLAGALRSARLIDADVPDLPEAPEPVGLWAIFAIGGVVHVFTFAPGALPREATAPAAV